jgi:hypothetical protein
MQRDILNVVLAASVLALACDEQPGTQSEQRDREGLTTLTQRATNAALEAKAAQADANGAAAAATVAGAGAPDEDLDMEAPAEESVAATDQPTEPRSPLLAPTPYGVDSRPPGDPDAVNDAYAVPGDPINEMETPRGNSIGEMQGERHTGTINEMETPRGNSISETERARKDGEDPISREPPRPR